MVDALALSRSAKLENSLVLIPDDKKYSQNYRVTRIKLEPIDITEEMAHDVFDKILHGTQAIVMGNHLVMCSCISSIDPLPLKNKPTNGHFDKDVWVEDK